MASCVKRTKNGVFSWVGGNVEMTADRWTCTGQSYHLSKPLNMIKNKTHKRNNGDIVLMTVLKW